MGRHEEEDPIPPNPNLYPQQLQLKLYQAFIFSIPILFSIILFLLFYLFYLKRRANNNNTMSMSSQSLSTSSIISHPWNLGIKGEMKERLKVVHFDEELKAKDSICCVCLGEFEMKEELRQLPLCKHVFHEDCIRNWLRANATCPLCRCPVIPAIKMSHAIGSGLDAPLRGPPQGDEESGSSTMNIYSTREEHVIHIVEEPSSSAINC